MQKLGIPSQPGDRVTLTVEASTDPDPQPEDAMLW